MKVCSTFPIQKFDSDVCKLQCQKIRLSGDKVQFTGALVQAQKQVFSKKEIIVDLVKRIAGLINKPSRATPLDLDKMLDPENLHLIMSSKAGKKNSLIFKINGKKIYPEFLNSGGTKAVYQVKIDDIPYAIAVCARSNSPELQAQKWSNVVNNEPRNTEILRNLGLKVNDLSEIYPIKINGYSFPAIRMKPYSSHSFQIFDIKEEAKYINPVIKAGDHINNKKCDGFFSQISKEIAVLLANNISLQTDSINLCFDKGILHLYFNDLDMKDLANPDISKDTAKYADYYSGKAVGAFIKSFKIRDMSVQDLSAFSKTYTELVEIIAKKSLSELEAIKQT